MSKPKPMLIILVDDERRVFVNGPTDKRLCLNLISEAIKVIANAEEKKPLIQTASVIPIFDKAPGGNGR